MTKGHSLSRPIKVIAACGNGTAGIVAPEALRRIGADVIPMDTELDYTFPKYNPNPEDMEMLHAMGDAVRAKGADICLGFDGDGDRCGVVDDKGHEIFADKIGVLVARDLSSRKPNAKFVVDVKSTGLFETDPVLKENGVQVDYWKTGHSYIKRRTAELGALAGFEKSGHYFFNPPIGPWLRRRRDRGHRHPGDAGSRGRQKDVGTGRRAAQDVEFAHHGALLPGRQKIRRRRGADERIRRCESQGRNASGAERLRAS